MEWKLPHQVRAVELLIEISESILNKLDECEIDTWYEEEAILYLEEICKSVKIVITPLPESGYESNSEGVNLLSINAISRTLMESTLTIYYLLRNRKDERAELEKLVRQYYHDSTRIRMTESLSEDATMPYLDFIKKRKDNARKKLEDNPIFNRLEKNVRNDILNGLEPKTIKPNDLIEGIGINSDRHWAMNSYLSQFIHPSPLMSDQSKLFSTKSNMKKELTKTCVANLANYLALVISFFVTHFPFQYEELIEDESEYTEKFVMLHVNYLKADVNVN